MAIGRMSSAVRQLRKAAVLREHGALTDGQLLESFLARGDEVAFEALVRRHGPMVLGVCRRVLHHLHDAEDAFQATFLVLVRKAAAVRPRERVGSWLYGVAYRTALKAKVTAARRRAHERQAPPAPGPGAADERWQELRPLLDRELSLLPEKYRAAVVLCDLEGRPRKEAARQLGWPEGTLSGRLARARALLARRLARHGVALAGGTLAAALGHEAAAQVPAALSRATARAATAVMNGQAVAAGAASAALAKGVLRTMMMKKLQAAAAVLLAVGVVGAGVGTLGHLAGAGAADTPEGTAAETRGQDAAQRLPEGGEGTRPNQAARSAVRDDRRKEIEEQLRKPISLNYKDTPLRAALDDVRNWSRVNIVIDRPALERAGLSADQPVTLRLESVSLRSALNHLLRQARLTFVLEDGVLVVTPAGAVGKTPPYLIEPPDILLVKYSGKDAELRRTVAGERLVRPDGTVGLGDYGSASVMGLTLDQAGRAIARRLRETGKDCDDKELRVDVIAYNSKFFYVIMDGTGQQGQQVVRLAATGNEAVLDAVQEVGGLTAAAKKHIWIARPGGRNGVDRILRVDWTAITRDGQAATNYQLLPGDRVFISDEPSKP
jgi:RNA polymerase sigma factor (sigma-70 family)